MAEQENQENQESETEESEIDAEEVISSIKNFYKKLTLSDLGMILLFVIIILIYVLYQKDIAACNAYCLDILENTTRLTADISIPYGC